MGARRGAIPVRWEAIQRPLLDERRIEFVHTGGVTKGMWVAWRFAERGDGARREHRAPARPGVAAHRRASPREHVIGPQFIEAIAGRTLRRIRELAEAGGR